MEIQKTATQLDQLTALKQQMLQMQAKLAEAPKKPEKPPVVSAPVEEEQPPKQAPREKTEKEIIADQLATERQALAEVAKGLFADLDAKQARANELRFARSLTEDEEGELTGLDHQIVEITDGFFGIIDLLEIWVGGHLDRVDEIRVSLNFVERGILEEITQAVAEEMRKARKEFFDRPQSERGGKAPEYFTAWDVAKEGVRYFRQRRYPLAEYRAKGAVFQEEAGRLLFALSAHYARVRKEEYEARQAEEKAEQERREAAEERRQEEDAMAEAFDATEVDPHMSLDDIERGGVSTNPERPLVKVVVERKHGWKMHKEGNPVVGLIYLKPLGKEAKGSDWSRFQFMGATSGIRHFLLNKGIVGGKMFRYRHETEFDGISMEMEDVDKEGKVEWVFQPYLRRLFGILMGVVGQTHVETPQSFNPILAAIEEGKSPAPEERKKHEKKGGGGGREHRPVRHRDGRGGGQNLLQKYIPYGKV